MRPYFAGTNVQCYSFEVADKGLNDCLVYIAIFACCLDYNGILKRIEDYFYRKGILNCWINITRRTMATSNSHPLQAVDSRVRPKCCSYCWP